MTCWTWTVNINDYLVRQVLDPIQNPKYKHFIATIFELTIYKDKISKHAQTVEPIQ